MLRLCKKSLFLIAATIGGGFLLRNYYLNAATSPTDIPKIKVGIVNMMEFSAILGMIATQTPPIDSKIQESIFESSKLTKDSFLSLQNQFNTLKTKITARDGIATPNATIDLLKIQNKDRKPSEGAIKTRLSSLHSSGLAQIAKFINNDEVSAWEITQTFNDNLKTLLDYISPNGDLKTLSELLSNQISSQTITVLKAKRNLENSDATKAQAAEAVLSAREGSRSIPAANNYSKTIRGK